MGSSMEYLVRAISEKYVAENGEGKERGIFYMTDKFDEFINESCEEKFLKNVDYIELQKKLVQAYNNNDIETYYDLTAEMNFLITSISYKLAIRNTIKFLIDK